MTRILKFLTIGLWILILIIWIGTFWLGIPVSVSDDVTKGIVDPMPEAIDKAILNRRLISALILLPALGIFGLIIHSIQKQKDRIFYIGMSITIIPLLVVGIAGLISESEMPYKNLILTTISIPLAFGLIIGMIEIFNLKISKKKIG